MAYRISRDAAMLASMGVPVATVRVAQRPVGPTFFSDRSSRVSPAVSAKVAAALRALGMLDERGLVTVDPRHTKGPWVSQLLELVPELRGAGGLGMVADHSQVRVPVRAACVWGGAAPALACSAAPASASASASACEAHQACAHSPLYAGVGGAEPGVRMPRDHRRLHDGRPGLV